MPPRNGKRDTSQCQTTFQIDAYQTCCLIPLRHWISKLKVGLISLTAMRKEQHWLRPYSHYDFRVSHPLFLRHKRRRSIAEPSVPQYLLLHLLLRRAASELSVGFAQIGDRHGHLTRIFGHDSGPCQEAVPSVKNEHLLVFKDIPGVK